ncbi:SDR family NAD(P)-dependent oxidoreductase [Streptomyces sp. Je 1-79]|uniref:SDR family NAD(P)-dependent oxidoreductase n=1 Tax=Streptomyces sp. Je 1-79 TaxID=2943847 RepID=UPI0021A47B8B|nr:SDR family NAD(P)-dependent oxidoreductase [Streptomyces sp. Je 1-79]MCT4353387.1 SDR family NAD(P)-dependent oxidoreductase [Streptomyces sp. Je 1-79]
MGRIGEERRADGESTGGAESTGGDSNGGEQPIGDEELAAFHRTVGRLRALPVDDPVRLRAEQVAESFSRDGRTRRRKARNDARGEADATVVAATATGAVARREDAPLGREHAGGGGVFHRPRRCYVCKSRYQRVDAFYHALCPECAADNSARRALSTDLTGRRALLTGGRVKIGFQLALMMLRDGVELLVTSRFPHDTLRRFQAVPGSDAWLDRLTVVAVDLRDPRQVLGVCERLHEAGEPLDILVNNAAQTVRRPPESYALLAAGESAALPGGAWAAPGYAPLRALEAPSAGGALALVLAEADEAGLLPDHAPVNSWSARIGELDPAELLETQLVNALAPALLVDRLLPLLLASPRPNRYVVNVTAVEGRFAVRNKTAGHPHTNMAKAALNMLTRTSGPELAAQGVHMCSVDTGWITDENPMPKKNRIAAQGFRTPLDIVDGAARVYDPIVRGEAGAPVSGVFLKDYQEAEW